MRTIHLLSIIAIVGAGCGSGVELVTPGPELSSRTSAIVNGQEDSGHEAVGMLRLQQGTTEGTCTGTLIGSKTVLTAAHCVNNMTSATFEVGGGTFSVAQMVAHPSYSDYVLNANDVGIAVLGEAVPGIRPMPLAQTAPQVGQAVTIVGFGITASGADDWGTKRVTQNTVSSVRTQYFAFAGSGGTDGNTCQGDSGGPTFRVDGSEEVLIGVHSTATMPCGAEGNDMRVDVFYGWIAEQAGTDLGVMADDTPPTVAIGDPAAGAVVAPTFTVSVTASDTGSGLASVTLSVDGTVKDSASASPASFTLSGLSAGAHTLKVEALDSAGNASSAQRSVTVEQGGTDDDPPPDTAGSFGSSCSTPGDCASKLCAQDSYVGASYCTQQCNQLGGCPEDADCVALNGDRQVCALRSSSGLDSVGNALVGGCSVGGGAPPMAGLWLLLGVLFLVGWNRAATTRGD